MKVTLSRFKKYTNIDSKSFNKGLTLFDGESGEGKSTYLEAVLWCLYGSMQHVYPIGSPSTPKKQTIVTLEFPELNNLTIRRSKPPDLLELSICGAILVSIEAQAYIENVFGNKELFITTSYIRQGMRCPLMSSSNTEKTQLLHLLTFGSASGDTEDPDLYLKKIDSTMQELKSIIVTETGKYNGCKQFYTSSTKEHESGYIKWNANKTVHIDTYKTISSNGGSEIREIDVNINTVTSTLSKKALLEEQISDIKIIVPFNLPDDTQCKIDTLTTLISSIYDQEQIQHELMFVRGKLSELDDMVNITHEELTDMKILRGKIYKEYEKARQLGVNYSEDGKGAKLRELNDTKGSIIKYEKDMIQYINEKETNDEQYKIDVKREEERVKSINDKLLIDYNKELEAYTTAESKFAEEMYDYSSLVKDQSKKLQEKTIYENHLKSVSKYKSQTKHIKLEILGIQTKIEKEYGWYSEHVKDGESVDYKHLQRTVQKLDQLTKQLHCPHCSGSLVFDNGDLKKGILDSCTIDKWSQHIQGIISYARDLKSITNNESLLSQNLATLSGLESTDMVVPDMTDITDVPKPVRHSLRRPTYTIVNANRIQYPPYRQQPCKETNYTIEEVDDLYKRVTNIHIYTDSLERIDYILGREPLIPHIQGYKDTIKSLEQKMVPIDGNIGDLQRDKRLLEDKLYNHAKETVLYENSVKQKAQLEEKLKSYADVSPSIVDTLQERKDTIVANMKEANIMLDSFKSFNILTDAFNSYESQRGILLRYNQHEANVLKLRTAIQEVASHAMEETVDAINVITNQILKEFFVDNIEVVIKTHKELKTKAISKLKINVQVTYKDNVFDSPSRLSGGEQDRISLALTMAIAKVADSPILMLDECISSLSESLQEVCLELLQEYCVDKTTINICHRSVEGQHDNILRCCQEL
jgi:DNA repair exonuclease SbcCD ATPase subunit